MNVFIDDEADFSWIVDLLHREYGIVNSDIENLYKEQRCNGINFNVLTKYDWVHDHRDYNPTKLNIMITDERCSDIVFIDEQERWDYRAPALLDVSRRHRVEDLHLLTKPRVMLQVFLLGTLAEYADRMSTHA